jgi:hypothetical protein
MFSKFRRWQKSKFRPRFQVKSEAIYLVRLEMKRAKNKFLMSVPYTLNPARSELVSRLTKNMGTSFQLKNGK